MSPSSFHLSPVLSCSLTFLGVSVLSFLSHHFSRPEIKIMIHFHLWFCSICVSKPALGSSFFAKRMFQALSISCFFLLYVSELSPGCIFAQSSTAWHLLSISSSNKINSKIYKFSGFFLPEVPIPALPEPESKFLVPSLLAP